MANVSVIWASLGRTVNYNTNVGRTAVIKAYALEENACVSQGTLEKTVRSSQSNSNPVKITAMEAESVNWRSVSVIPDSKASSVKLKTNFHVLLLKLMTT